VWSLELRLCATLRAVDGAGRAGRDLRDFGPVAPRGLDASAYPLTGEVKKDLFTWPEVEGDVNIHGSKSR
jgi:gamma-glutamyltranspeptidase/glutathione hydrolase